jgi:MFS transporter, PAT family, beta-lactamase induction signal transducer AmpG
MDAANQRDLLLPDALPSVLGEAKVRGDRPWIFGLLVAPSAVVANGIVQGGVLGYLLTQQGMRIDIASHWLSILALPTSLYFLYSPLTDFLLKRRTWLMLGSIGAAVLMLLAFHQQSIAAPAPLRLILLSGCLTQLVFASCGGMMGTLHSDKSRHTACGFFQAGSLAFGALATWLLIRESTRMPAASLGWMAAAMIGLPSLLAFFAPHQPVVRSSGLLQTLRILGRECKATFLRWDSVPYLIYVLLPAGTGAAIGLLPSIAQSYGINSDQIAWMNGLIGAFAIAAGSMVTALFPTRWGIARPALVVYILNALILAGMAFGPMRPWNYLSATILYLFTTGCCYSTSTAIALEFIGESGKSGSGRFSVINGLINVPVLLMISVDGWGAARWGARGLPAIECVAALAASIPMLIFVCLRPLRPTVIETTQVES